MKKVVYDSAVLVAADRNERRVWAEHKVRLEAGIIPLVPAPVVAQVSRSPKQAQAQMRRLLRGCETAPFDEASAHAAGRLLALTKTSDVVDAAVALLGSIHRADVVTGDPDDIRRLLAAARAKVTVIEV
jgi:predicted nucleic acid-binding protein